jgi:E3 ubiquitin-protein ligase MARCH6
MEWLAHSQKKYCELCKTQFTFTKVYDPDMPRTLPTPLFVRQLSRRLTRSMVKFFRAGLVAFVWLGCLPWCVRWMWRAWFWISDGEWLQLGAASSATEPHTIASNASVTATSTGIFPIVFPSAVASLLSRSGNATVAANVTSAYPDGIFFDRNPFYNATRFQFVNGLIVDVLEGQLLTALIVVTFIIIFLIREWVVQQQPAILGDAANIPLLNEQPAAVAEPVPAAVDGAADEAPREEPDDDDEDAWVERAFGVEPVDEGTVHDGLADETVGAQILQQRPIAQPRRRLRVHTHRPNTPEATPEATPETTTQTTTREERGESSTSTGFNFGGQSPEPTSTAHAAPSFGPEPEESTTTATRNAGTNTSPAVYDFGGIGARAENLFQFGGGNPEPSRPPSMWDPNTRQEARLVDDAAERLELIDTGRTSEWIRENTPSAPSSPVISGLFGYDGSGSASWGSTGSFELVGGMKDKGKDRQQSEDSIEGEGSANKGKGKEIPQMDAQVDSDNEDSGNEKELRTEGDGSLSVGISGWSTNAHAGTLSSESSSTSPPAMPPTPPPIPERLDLDNVYHRRPGTDLPRQDVRRLDDARHAEQIRNRALMRQAVREGFEREERERIGRPAAEEPQELQDQNMDVDGGNALPEPQGRGGLLNWFLGEDEDAGPLNADDDIDDEAPAAPVAAVPQGMLEDDAADDFEGIMELLGMRGPIIGLVQNAAISSMLITATVAVGVALPYVTGKIVMLLLAHPILFFCKLPWLLVSFAAEFLVDSTTMVAFTLLMWAAHVIEFFISIPMSAIPGMSKNIGSAFITKFLQNWATDGQTRVLAKFSSIETTYLTIRKFPPSAVPPPLSLVVRDSFEQFLGYITWTMEKIGLSGLSTIKLPFGVPNPIDWTAQKWQHTFASIQFHQPANATVSAAAEAVTDACNWSTLDRDACKWSTWDRIGVVLLGYAFFTFLGMCWVSRRRNQPAGHVQKLVVEILQQCGGVMKVVLIIGIEMFVFPLYCGILLGESYPITRNTSSDSRGRHRNASAF